MNKGTFPPNLQDGVNHVFKICSGGGKHCEHVASLKFAVKSLLEEKKFDFYEEMNHGIFLVRFVANS